VNFFLAFFSSVPDFATELPIYNYVETNATTVAGLTLFCFHLGYSLHDFTMLIIVSIVKRWNSQDREGKLLILERRQ